MAMSSSCPVELQLSAPESFNGDSTKATTWLNAISFYLIVNNEIYKTNAKKIVCTLSYMTKVGDKVWLEMTNLHMGGPKKLQMK